MLHDQAVGFALHALDPAEAAEFERHLSVCADCAEELGPLTATAAALAFAGELSQPPPNLRLRVLDVGAPVIPLPRRPGLLAAAAVAAACVAIVLGVQSSGPSPLSAAGLKSYGVQGMNGALLVGRSGEAVLIVQDIPSPAPGTAYELWIVRGSETTPAGFLRGQLGMLTGRVPRGATVALSLEPAAGSNRPTGPLLLTTETA